MPRGEDGDSQERTIVDVDGMSRRHSLESRSATYVSVCCMYIDIKQKKSSDQSLNKAIASPRAFTNFSQHSLSRASLKLLTLRNEIS